MRWIRLMAAMALIVVLAGFLSGAACTQKNGEPVGIENIVNNGDGTFTVTLSDGSVFTSDNLTGSKGDQGPRGDTAGSEVLTSDGSIMWQWGSSEGVFLIPANHLGPIDGAGFPANRTVQIFLVVAPTSSTLLATVTTNDIGCFHAYPAELNEGATIQVVVDGDLDWIYAGETRRDCYLQAVVDGAPVASTPVCLFGLGETDVREANAELLFVQDVIERCMADAQCATFSTYGPWDGTKATSPIATCDGLNHYASDYLSDRAFKATYTIDAAGSVVDAALNPAPGEAAWVGIYWDGDTNHWVNIYPSYPGL